MPMLQIDGQDIAEIDDETANQLTAAAARGRGRLAPKTVKVVQPQEEPGFQRQVQIDVPSGPAPRIELVLEFLGLHGA